MSNTANKQYRYSSIFKDLFRGYTFTGGYTSISYGTRSEDIEYLDGETVIATVPRDAVLTPTNIDRYRKHLGFENPSDLCRVNQTYNALVDVRNELADPFYNSIDAVDEHLSEIDEILDALLRVQQPSADDLLESGAGIEWPIPVDWKAP